MAAADLLDYQNQLGFTLKGVAAGGIPAWSVTDAYLTGRCDSTATSSSVGCVNQNFTPTLVLPKAQGGASAAMVQWAQENLSGHWGLRGEGAPLHYLGDDIIRDNNREVICPDSWAHDPEIDADLVPYDAQDSCDEFPFARTYESGAMADNVNGDPKPYVTTGDDCAQVTAKQTGFTNNPDNLAADWPTITVDGTPTLSEPASAVIFPRGLTVLSAVVTVVSCGHGG